VPLNPFESTDITVAVVVLTIGALLRAWISLRKVRLREQSETDRFTKAIEGSSPHQRPEIIRAMSASRDTSSDRPAPARAPNDDQLRTPDKISRFAWIVRLWRKLLPPAGD
jgi:hypothetical protein